MSDLSYALRRKELLQRAGAASKVIGKANDPKDALRTIVRQISADTSLSPDEKRRLYKQAAEGFLALRAAEGLTDAEMQDLRNKAFGRINVSQRVANTGRQAQLARAGIKQDSGLGIATKSRLDKGATIAKGRTELEMKRMDEDARNRALGALIGIPDPPRRRSKLGQLLGSLGKAAAATVLSGGNPAAGAVSLGTDLVNSKTALDDPRNLSRKNLFYDDPYGSYA